MSGNSTRLQQAIAVAGKVSKLQPSTRTMSAPLALSTVASLMPARNASRLTIREVLAYE